MPTETRYLVFSLAEVEGLLRRGLARLKKPAPAERLVCLNVWKSRYAFMYETQNIVLLAPAELFACVLWECQAGGIPVPRSFEKRLEVVDDQLILVCGTLNLGRAAEEALRLGRRGRVCALCDGEQQRCMLQGADAGAELLGSA